MEDLWSRIYTMASKCTLDTKTRIFQFKILNNVLYLNKQLYKMNLSVSPWCLLCLKEQETFTHLFLECSYSSNLWRELQRSLSPKLSLPNLNVKNLTVGLWNINQPRLLLITFYCSLNVIFTYAS